MNNKLLTYEEAVADLKELEIEQKINKKLMTSNIAGPILRSLSQANFERLKKDINRALTLVIVYKQARKMYGKLNA